MISPKPINNLLIRNFRDLADRVLLHADEGYG